MQRFFARKLIALLLLLALVAGGDRLAAVAVAMDMNSVQMGDVQEPEMSCKTCDGTMADMPCDALCAALPATEVPLVALSNIGLHERWMIRSENGASYSIRPDTSPPRA